MASSARIDELLKKYNENQRRYFAPLANEYRKAGDLGLAIQTCEEHLPYQPGHMSGHIVYGQALFESGRLDDARGVFETALSLDPENLIALRHLGDIAAQQSDPTVARRWYERVLEADPRNDEIQQLIARLDDAPEPVASHAPVPEEPALEVHSPHSDPSELADLAVSFHDQAPERRAHDLDATLAHGMPAISPAPSDLPADLPAEHWELPTSAAAPAHEEREFEPLSLDAIVPMPTAREPMPEVAGRADGFEATEFEAPAAPVEQAAGLQSAYEDETGLYGAPSPRLEGLEGDESREESPEPARDTPPHREPSGLPEVEPLEDLVEDDRRSLPPHGDPVAHPGFLVPPEREAASDFPTLDAEFEIPDASPAGAALPVELPPEVIAAEAELTDLDTELRDDDRADDAATSVGGELPWIDTTPSAASETPESDARDADEDESSFGTVQEPTPAQQPFVTETMAELYLKQGFRDQALAVYEQLSAASPRDARLSARLAELRQDSAAATVVGPTARDFFSMFGNRRPGERQAARVPPSDGDFGGVEWSGEAVPDGHDARPAPPPSDAAAGPTEPRHADAPGIRTPAAPMMSAVDRAATTQAPGGSIDALFGNRPATTTEDSAASALAQAFGSGAEAPPAPIAGNPARQAAGELSLDSVFRDGASRGRSSQGFSFDQFFSQNAEGERTTGGRSSGETVSPGEPAEKSADDIEQFNSWLQGLKQR